VTYPLAS